MNYIKKNLPNGEFIVTKARFSWGRLILIIFVSIILLIVGGNTDMFMPMFAISALLVIITILQILSTELILTNKKIIGKTGFFNVKSTEAHLEKIDSITVVEHLSAFKILFGYSSHRSTNATLIIRGGFKPMCFFSITNAIEFKNSLQNYTDLKKGQVTGSSGNISGAVRTNKSCQNCSFVNPPESTFCIKCGYKL